ncbi:MAG TPA: STAS domain-containing protein [Patescibacteria group bacterium]|nr:STAS domain-containing protein [Patescibacteria group bacterium]
MKSTIRTAGDGVELILDGRFTFADHAQFRQDVDEICGLPGRHCLVDLSAVSYMDSAAVGMLLLIRERVETKGGHVSLRGGSPPVKDLIRIAKLGSVFTILD